MNHSTHNALHDPRNESILIYINGEHVQRHEAKISVFDSGYLVGDGIWEAMRLSNSILVFAEDHLNRLWDASKLIGLDFGFSKQELLQAIHEILKANAMTDGVHVRVMITRGNKKTPSQDPRLTITKPNVVIIPEYKIANPETKKSGISLFTSTIRRGSPDYLDPKLNCHSKLHEVIALIQAQQAGADEALMLDTNGFVATCNSTNFFIVKDGTVFTSTGQYCMNGITRAKVIEACQKNNIPIKACDFSLFETYSADEAFVTGTFGGITPVHSIDGRNIAGSNNSTTAQLMIHYQELINDYIAQKNVI